MSNDRDLRKVISNADALKGRAMPQAPAPGREGYAMPAQATSPGPVSARPGSAVPPKANGK
jgi:hypothetical protein